MGKLGTTAHKHCFFSLKRFSYKEEMAHDWPRSSRSQRHLWLCSLSAPLPVCSLNLISGLSFHPRCICFPSSIPPPFRAQLTRPFFMKPRSDDVTSKFHDSPLILTSPSLARPFISPSSAPQREGAVSTMTTTSVHAASTHPASSKCLQVSGGPRLGLQTHFLWTKAPSHMPCIIPKLQRSLSVAHPHTFLHTALSASKVTAAYFLCIQTLLQVKLICEVSVVLRFLHRNHFISVWN